MDDPVKAAATVEERLARVNLYRHAITAAGRAWQIDAVRDQDQLLAAADHFGTFPYGLLLWDGAIVLADALSDLGSLDARRVLDLGAGVGLTGLAAAHLGATVLQTDHAPEALALAWRNAALNQIDGITQLVADWTRWDVPGQFDVIVGSDILYDSSAHAPIAFVLDASLTVGGVVVLTDPGRTATPLLVQHMREAGWLITQSVRRIDAVHQVREGDTVEITILTLRRE